MHINEPNGEAKNEAYVPRKIKKHRGCTLIAVVAVIILLVLELYPMFEVRFFGGFPSLSTALKMTKEPYYSFAKPFVDFMIVMMILAIASLVGGIFKTKPISLVSSLIAVLQMLQLIYECANETNNFASDFVQFAFGFYLLLGANIVIFIASLVEK